MGHRAFSPDRQATDRDPEALDRGELPRSSTEATSGPTIAIGTRRRRPPESHLLTRGIVANQSVGTRSRHRDRSSGSLGLLSVLEDSLHYNDSSGCSPAKPDHH